MKLHRLLFVAILLFFLLKGLFFIFLIPPWEAPDEPGHVNYVFYLYKNHKIPDTSIAPGLVTAIVTSWDFQKEHVVPKIQKKEQIKQKELFNRNAFVAEKSFNNISAYPPLYYLYLLPFLLVSMHFSSYMSYIFLCFGSLILGGFSLVITFYIARLFFSKSFLPHVVVLLFSLTPMVTFIFSVVNNDAMVIPAFLMFIYLILKNIFFAKNISTKMLLLSGLYAGFATLIKPQLLILVPIFFSTLFWQKKKGASLFVLTVVSSCLFPLGWYGYKFLQQGSSSLSYAFVSKQNTSTNIFLYPIEFVKSKQPIGIFMSFWGLFGWLDIVMSKYIYVLFALVMIIGCVGWFLKKNNKISNEKNSSFLFFILTSILYISFIFLYDILFFAKGGHFGIQGRYFLPLLLLFLITITQGILFFNRKLQMLLFAILVVIFLLGQVVMYMSITKTYFHEFYLMSPLVKVYLK